MKIKKFTENINETSKYLLDRKIQKFLDDLTMVSQKYGIYLDTTDDMFMTNDEGDIGSIMYDAGIDKYISMKD